MSQTMSKAAGRASPHKGRPGRNPAAILKSENGDINYFSTVVFIFIAVLLLAFILDLFSIIMRCGTTIFLPQAIPGRIP